MSNPTIVTGFRLGESYSDKVIEKWYQEQPKKALSLRDTLFVGIQIKEQFPTLFRLIIEFSQQGKELDHTILRQLLDIDKMMNGECNKQQNDSVASTLGTNNTAIDPVKHQDTENLEPTNESERKTQTQPKAKKIPPLLQSLGR
ncbi:hypothetical protein ABT56_19135 [Photobacterium aquae]|uniref:Uncharacterized protein n=1 Tax=Photobacterium aquae TaxID=1195763 RepID=A0A0J1GVS1_9GAMM|nr:hypothetical protein [Photobacterium aquae]KLV03544.1 hypothetical protein ABT56_19135 [Photobacterium aquae]